MQDDVQKWLDILKLGQYKNFFKLEGFSTKEDLENLKSLKKEDFESIGITMRGKNYLSLVYYNAGTFELANSCM